jgi:xanthine dehydrogenase YagR molybdenum-binding subunit
MAAWPESTNVIGSRVNRLDGLAKASGKAKYPSDMHPEGMLFAAVLYSPHAHAKITALDLTPADKMPGVKATHAIAKVGGLLRYQGDDIAAVAAETEEQALDALKAIKIEYELQPFVVTEEQAMAPDAPPVFKPNVRKGRTTTKGEDPEKEFADAPVKIEGTYSAPVITHVCLEPHGLTAMWKGDDRIVAYASTQAVQVTAAELAQRFNIPVTNVEVITEVMGGGFGSKFGADIWGLTAAELSKKAGGRPVKLFLDRIQEHLAAGNRPSATAHVKLAATKEGRLVSMVAETRGTGGARGGSNFPLPYVYDVPNVSRTHSEVFVNAGLARAMRAPGHPQGSLIMEAAMDDLAEALGMDPIEFRLKNLAANDRVPSAGAPGGLNRSDIYRAELKIGAELIGWDRRKPRGKAEGKGPVKRGFGLGLHQWGGGGPQDKKVDCIINPDGSVEMRSGFQDIGTGARTVLAIIAAEVFGLKPTDITSNIGHSTFPPGQASGGSTTTPAMSPPAYNAAVEARGELFKKLAPIVGATKPEDLSLKDGKLLVAGEAKMSWKEACRKLGQVPISVTGKGGPGLSAQGVGGCQFAEVLVDIETGVVKLVKVVAVQDTGLIINKQAWETQVYGGVIGGLNYGLFEDRVMDPNTGQMLNPDLEMYKVAGASDIPEIVVHAYETAEMKARGVIGVGEPPTISTAAAIGNAVANAIGVRVPVFPMNPINVLNALSSAQEGKA